MRVFSVTCANAGEQLCSTRVASRSEREGELVTNADRRIVGARGERVEQLRGRIGEERFRETNGMFAHRGMRIGERPD